jgi:hypothetical protein
MAPPKRYVTQAEFARLFQVSDAEISRAVKSGRVKTITRGGRKFIDVKTEAGKFASTAKQIFTRTPSPAILAGAGAGGPAGDEEGTGPLFDTYMSKQQQEKYKALRAKLDYEKEMGELVPIGEVQTQWINVAVLVRKTIMNMPDRLAPLLAAEDDARKCWALLDEECRTILEDLANELGGE